MITHVICPLCAINHTTQLLPELLGDQYFHCPKCDLRFLNSKYRLNSEDEKKRYLTHNNDVNDPGYQNFVAPLYQEIRKRAQPLARGLDFGAGPGPVIADLLQKDGFRISLYDPYFWPHPDLLNDQYDFVFACEVIEHLYDPHLEFKRMKSCLKIHGFLGLMTHVYDETIDFASWYYRKDPTHVAFYSKETFAWIKEHYGFSDFVFASTRTIVLF